MTDSAARFRVHDRPLAAYSDPIFVVCPNCEGRAVVVPRPGLPELRYYSEFRPRRLACPGCGTTRDWAAQRRNHALSVLLSAVTTTRSSGSAPPAAGTFRGSGTCRVDRDPSSS